MKRSIPILTLLALLIFPATALAQVEAAITRGACGSVDVALMLRTFEPSPTVENASLSRTRVRSGLATLMERELALTLLDDGTVVACGAIPASADEANADRVEVALEPTTTDRQYGYAILREFTPDRTTIFLAIPGVATADETVPAPVQRTPVPTAQPESASASQQERAASTTPAGYDLARPARIGTTLDVEGIRVTPTNPRFVGEYEFSTPKGGYMYLVVDVRIENTGSEERFYSYSDFSGEDARTGVGYDSSIFFSSDFIGFDSLDPGEFVTGTVIIEVQSTSQGLVLKYDPIPFSEPDMFWGVSR